jgi:plasmid stabilization system protein ParE
LKPPVFRAAAAADVEEAYRWYQGQREDLGNQFLEVVQDALETILRHPEAAPIIHRDTRRLLLRRFPYGVHYRVIDGGVVVVACFHAKRSPRIWRGRR